MSILLAVQFAAVALLAVSVAESFRARPWWPHSPARPYARGPARGTSPGERRWVHGGLAVVLVANVLSVRGDGDTTVAVAGMVLLALGAAAIVIGLVRGPSAADREEFAHRFAAELEAEEREGRDAGAM